MIDNLKCSCFQDEYGSYICQLCYPVSFKEHASQEKWKFTPMKQQSTSETYDHGRYIVIQDGDDEAFRNGNYYTAHLYFNSMQEWEIKEEYNTYLIR